MHRARVRCCWQRLLSVVGFSLEHIVSETEQKLDDHLKTLTKSLTRAQLQLQQLSGLISGVASVFSEHQAREPQLPVGAKAPKPRAEGHPGRDASDGRSD